MSLKEELAELEREEEIDDREEARLNAMQEDIYRLHRRIAVIVEHIDKGEPKEEPLTEEEMWECGFDAGYEEGEKHANKTARECYEDGVRALSEKIGDDIDQAKVHDKWIGEAIDKVLSIKTPESVSSGLLELLAMQSLGKKEEMDKATTEGQQWSSDYVKGYDDGVKKMIDNTKEEIKAIEKALSIKAPSSNLTSLLHAIQQGLATIEPEKEPKKTSGL